MGYSLQDFSRDTREVLKAGSGRSQIQRIYGRQTGAPAAIAR